MTAEHRPILEKLNTETNEPTRVRRQEQLVADLSHHLPKRLEPD
jgi:hypothetical protein